MRNFYTDFIDFNAFAVKNLPKALKALGLSSFRVATRKLADSADAPAVEIIVRSDGGPTDNFLKSEGFTVYVFASAEDESDAEILLAEATEAVAKALQVLPFYSSGAVKKVEEPLISDFENHGLEQSKIITSEALILGKRKLFEGESL